jgi:2-polyprenyl-6-methoxyphenol hydroxylase-like FAD-dependent oxidoreductase
MSQNRATVIIVGAGPVGLLTALRLGQAGISTLVLESHHTLLPTTRAMVYMPVVIPVLRELGILDVVLQNAFLNQEGVTWRDLDGNALAQLPLSSSTPGEFGGVLLFGQSRMNALILEGLKKYPSVEVRFGLRCVGIEDSPSSPGVKVMVHQRNLVDEDIIFEAEYVLASDGANSSVRRMMCIPFEGFSFQKWKMIGCDVGLLA